jgi:hypothetical protein
MTALQLIRLLEAAPKDAEIVIAYDGQMLPPQQIHFAKVIPVWSADENNLDPIGYVPAALGDDPDPSSGVIIYADD